MNCKSIICVRCYCDLGNDDENICLSCGEYFRLLDTADFENNTKMTARSKKMHDDVRGDG